MGAAVAPDVGHRVTLDPHSAVIRIRLTRRTSGGRSSMRLPSATRSSCRSCSCTAPPIGAPAAPRSWPARS